MQRNLLIAGSCALILVALFLIFDRKTESLKLVGGPEGGTFTVFADVIVELLRAEDPTLQIVVIKSGGSVSNLKMVDSGRVTMALAYAGDAYLGWRGQLSKIGTPMENVRALGRIYGSTAHLVVSHGSTIQTPDDLAFRRVAVGSFGSGAAHSAERYFRILGIWESISPVYLGYDLATAELVNGQVEAIWQLVGAPSTSISALNDIFPIRLIDLTLAARKTYFFVKYPFYTETLIPPETYRNQDQGVETFQDNSLLVANTETDPKLISLSLRLLFSPEGIALLRKAHPAAQDLDINKGLQGVRIPLHPAAETFWREQGLL